MNTLRLAEDANTEGSVCYMEVPGGSGKETEPGDWKGGEK